jgi:preprotein translocase SecF subunit
MFQKMDFVALRKYAFLLSAFIILVGAASLATAGLNLGIDFTGGTNFMLNIGREFTLEEARQVLSPLGLEGAVIQKVGAEGLGEGEKQELLLKTPALTPEEQDNVFKAFSERYDLTDKDLLSVESVGAVVGGELQRQAFLALLIASVGMVLYITIRFEFRFALSAIAALLHDALIVLAFFSLFRIEINSPFVAAILMILGYSVNDTIVIFDRIRENMKNRHRQTLAEIVNTSIRDSLRRSVNTSVTTLLVLVTLLAFGGITLRPFISALLVGIIAGTYSSIFIASPLWLSWKQLQDSGKRKLKTA